MSKEAPADTVQVVVSHWAGVARILTELAQLETDGTDTPDTCRTFLLNILRREAIFLTEQIAELEGGNVVKVSAASNTLQ